MRKRMHAVVLFIEPHEVKFMTPLKAGNLFVNRLSMNEDESNKILKVFEFEIGSGDATVEDENLT